MPLRLIIAKTIFLIECEQCENKDHHLAMPVLNIVHIIKQTKNCPALVVLTLYVGGRWGIIIQGHYQVHDFCS